MESPLRLTTFALEGDLEVRAKRSWLTVLADFLTEEWNDIGAVKLVSRILDPRGNRP